MLMPSLYKFREFVVRLKSAKRHDLTQATLNKLYRPRATQAIAKKFLAVRLAKATVIPMRGYSTGMRLSLCHSTAEAMGAVIEKHVVCWGICDARLEGL